jgi:hypothetical protein
MFKTLSVLPMWLVLKMFYRPWRVLCPDLKSWARRATPLCVRQSLWMWLGLLWLACVPVILTHLP